MPCQAASSILALDPKTSWALAHRELFPVDVNTAGARGLASRARAGRSRGQAHSFNTQNASLAVRRSGSDGRAPEQCAFLHRDRRLSASVKRAGERALAHRRSPKPDASRRSSTADGFDRRAAPSRSGAQPRGHCCYCRRAGGEMAGLGVGKARSAVPCRSPS